MRMKWTREVIIRHLVEREAAGQPLTIGGKGISVAMYNAIRRNFGSWRNAVQAAGITPQHVLTWERWTPSRILATIRYLAKRGRPMTCAEIEHRYGQIIPAARRHFGSWVKAALIAGVDPARLQRVASWNQQRVIEEVLTRALRGESLDERLVQPRALLDAGLRIFGSWEAALTSAGIDPKKIAISTEHAELPRLARIPRPRTISPHKPRQLWTRKLVVASLRARLRAHKYIDNATLSREDRGLCRATRRHFGTWRDALIAAGLDPAAHPRRVAVRSQKKKAPIQEPATRQSQSNEVTRPDNPA